MKRVLPLGLVLLAALVLTTTAGAATYYVSLNGNDSWDGLAPSFVSGTKGPFRSFQRAAYAVRPGDTVHIRGGVYVGYGGSWGYSYSGTAASPITVTAYPGETVIIDGSNHSQPPDAYTPLMQIYGDYYKVSNIELRYGSYAGLNIIGNHCTVENIYSHHNDGSGIFTAGQYNKIVNCRADYNSMDNEYGRLAIGWGFGISLCRNARYCTISGCTSWNNWGEGLSIASGYYCTIEDSVSYDNFSTNIYVSQSVGGVVRRNLSYYTPGNVIQGYVSSQNGIFVGDEGNPPDSTGNTVINNLVMGGDRCLLVNGEEGTNLLVANNTFANAFGRLGPYESGCVFFNAGASSGGRFVNNIVYQADSTAISHLEATGISFHHNSWSRLPVSGCRGTGDVVADPLLLRTGSTLAGELAPGWFRVQSGSPVAGKAQALSQVTEDFAKALRPDPPDMGAFNATAGPSDLTVGAAGTPTSGLSPLTVTFTGSVAGGASPYAYEWAFGDGGTSTAQNPAHIYASPGRYTATFTVTDGNRSVARGTVGIAVDSSITSVFVASASASTLSGPAPLAVNFTGGGSGGEAPYTYSWSFGDGGAASGPGASHTYAAAGTYAVRLTVTDQKGAVAASDLTIRVTSPVAAALSAGLAASPISGPAPLAVNFAGTASGGTGPYTYLWSFGDKTTSTAQNPQHVYEKPGTYVVTLTIRDSRWRTTYKSIRVQAGGSARKTPADRTVKKKMPSIVLH